MADLHPTWNVQAHLKFVSDPTHLQPIYFTPCIHLCFQNRLCYNTRLLKKHPAEGKQPDQITQRYITIINILHTISVITILPDSLSIASKSKKQKRHYLTLPYNVAFFESKLASSSTNVQFSSKLTTPHLLYRHLTSKLKIYLSFLTPICYLKQNPSLYVTILHYNVFLNIIDSHTQCC